MRDHGVATNGMQTEARRAERRSTRAASTIRTDTSGPIDVVVLDVSATGVRIVTAAELEIGQEISLGLAGAGVTRAFVARRDGEQYGCTFEAPIGEDVSARAFSNASVVRLGQRVSAASGQADLRELYRQHHFWQVPLDAVVATLVIVGGGLFALWHLAG
jgi:hypothetical protein